MTTFKVEVNQDHIDLALPKDSGHCMIADAIKSMGGKFVSVDISTIRFTKGNTRYTFLTPQKAQMALLSFDHGIKPEPFGFRLQRPVHVRPKGDQNTPRELKTGNKKRIVVSGGRAPRSNGAYGVRTGRIRTFGIRGIGVPEE